MTQCEAKYKIQVGSWTDLPEGRVQEDTRGIMKMMADKIGGRVETHPSRVRARWHHVGVDSGHVVLVCDTGDGYNGLENEPPLFIPYEELQRMLKSESKKITSLLNTKLDCRKPDGTIDVELSKAFQEACFEQGIKWASGVTHCKNLDDCYLYVCESRLTSESTPTIDRDYFKRHKGRQINFTYSRKLQWEAVEAEPADEIVTIGGVGYSAKELKEALELIGKAKK